VSANIKRKIQTKPSSEADNIQQFTSHHLYLHRLHRTTWRRSQTPRWSFNFLSTSRGY